MSRRLARLFLSCRALWPVFTALVLRLTAAGAVEAKLEADGREFLIAGDAAGYLDLAEDIGEGRLYAVDAGWFPRRAMRVPLFPLTLAGPLWLERHADWLPAWDGHALCRLTVVLCGTLAVWATGRLGDAVGGPRVGEAAAWLAAVNPLAIAFSVMLLSESLFAALVTLSLAGVAECVRRDPLTGEEPRSLRWGPAIWGGLAAAGATLTRPVWLPFAPCVVLLACVLAWRAGDLRRAGWAVAFFVAFLVGFAPWPLRNQAVLGQPILTTTWGGPTLYDSLGPQADGSSDMRFCQRAVPQWSEPDVGFDFGAVPPRLEPQLQADLEGLRTDASWAGPNAPDLSVVLQAFSESVVLQAVIGGEIASDTLYRQEAWRAARADPARVARLAVVKQRRFWRPWPVGGMPGGAVGAVMKAGFAAFFLPLVGLAVWGGVRFWRDGGGEVGPVWALVLTWGPILGFAAVCLVFVGSVRYRLPGEFPLCVAAAVGGLDLWRRRGARPERTGG